MSHECQSKSRGSQRGMLSGINQCTIDVKNQESYSHGSERSISDSSHHESDSSGKDEFNRRLGALLSKPDNKICADCSAKEPKWASIIVPPPEAPQESNPLGVFCCIDCCGLHRRLGTHISFVRSITLDEWKEQEVIAMELGGNKKVNEVFEAKGSLAPAEKPADNPDISSREYFIRNKYQERKYYDPVLYARYSKIEDRSVVDSIMGKLDKMRCQRYLSNSTSMEISISESRRQRRESLGKIEQKSPSNDNNQTMDSSLGKRFARRRGSVGKYHGLDVPEILLNNPRCGESQGNDEQLKLVDGAENADSNPRKSHPRRRRSLGHGHYLHHSEGGDDGGLNCSRINRARRRGSVKCNDEINVTASESVQSGSHSICQRSPSHSQQPPGQYENGNVSNKKQSVQRRGSLGHSQHSPKNNENDSFVQRASLKRHQSLGHNQKPEEQHQNVGSKERLSIRCQKSLNTNDVVVLKEQLDNPLISSNDKVNSSTLEESFQSENHCRRRKSSCHSQQLHVSNERPRVQRRASLGYSQHTPKSNENDSSIQRASLGRRQSLGHNQKPVEQYQNVESKERLSIRRRKSLTINDVEVLKEQLDNPPISSNDGASSTMEESFQSENHSRRRRSSGHSQQPPGHCENCNVSNERPRRGSLGHSQHTSKNNENFSSIQRVSLRRRQSLGHNQKPVEQYQNKESKERLSIRHQKGLTTNDVVVLKEQLDNLPISSNDEANSSTTEKSCQFQNHSSRKKSSGHSQQPPGQCENGNVSNEIPSVRRRGSLGHSQHTSKHNENYSSVQRASHRRRQSLGHNQKPVEQYQNEESTERLSIRRRSSLTTNDVEAGSGLEYVMKEQLDNPPILSNEEANSSTMEDSGRRTQSINQGQTTRTVRDIRRRHSGIQTAMLSRQMAQMEDEEEKVRLRNEKDRKVEKLNREEMAARRENILDLLKYDDMAAKRENFMDTLGYRNMEKELDSTQTTKKKTKRRRARAA